MAAAASHSPEALQAAVLAFKTKARRLRINRNYWKLQAIKFKAERNQAIEQLQELQRGGKAPVRRGSTKGTASKYFTPVGGLRVGLRANLCHTPAAYFAHVMEMDLSRYTVSRWEIVVDACLRKYRIDWHSARYEKLIQGGGYVVHALRSDATNAKI